MKTNPSGIHSLIVALPLLLVASSPILAQTDAGGPAREQPVLVTPSLPVSARVSRSEMRSDQRILRKSAASNNYKIAISREALARSVNPRIRTYAEMMVRDHDRLSRELTTLAARRGVTLDNTAALAGNASGFSQKTGSDYDQAYIEEMVDAHEDAIALLEKASKSKDPDIAAFGVQYLPTLREHLVHSLELESAFD